MSSEAGFALPSVLMLVTVLSLVAFSVLALLYFERESAYRDVARVKAEYAAQSGVARMMEDLRSGLVHLGDQSRVYVFVDSSSAEATASRWGAYLFVQSKGRFRRSVSQRTAVVGEWPGDQFSSAVILGNFAHQLVLTGSASIIGDILVGSGGVTTGSISGYSTPASLPVKGEIKKSNQSSLPEYSFDVLNETVSYFRHLCAGDPKGAGTNPVMIANGMIIPDTVQNCILGANAILADSLGRMERPLYIASTSGIKIGSSARLYGLITIVSSDTVLIERGARIHGCVIVGLRGITVRSNALSSAQLLSSRIEIEAGTRCAYPSLALSLPFDTSQSKRQELVMQSGATLEGFAGLISPRGDDVLDIQEGAHVTGAAYSSARMTLDGSVTGSALAYDFYFYEAPSIYLGWLRKGTVNRKMLPKGFLVPMIFSGDRRLGVLDWM